MSAVTNENEKQTRSMKLPQTRVTPDEFAAIKQNALNAGKSFADFQREMLLDGRVIVRENVADNLAVSQLLAIGRNLNQLTKSHHIHAEYDRERLHNILNTIESIAAGLISDS